MSNRPENMSVYDELDLKLGIKSSLPQNKNFYLVRRYFLSSHKYLMFPALPY